MQDEPSLPWVLRQGSLRFRGFGTDEEGRTTLLFHSTTRGSPLRTLVIHMRSTEIVEWVYGYVLIDHDTKKRTTYRGRFGDPQYDREVTEP